jgi:hypothetical protein
MEHKPEGASSPFQKRIVRTTVISTVMFSVLSGNNRCSELHENNINTLWGLNVKFCVVKPFGTLRDLRALKSSLLSPFGTRRLPIYSANWVKTGGSSATMASPHTSWFQLFLSRFSVTDRYQSIDGDDIIAS